MHYMKNKILNFEEQLPLVYTYLFIFVLLENICVSMLLLFDDFTYLFKV